MADQLPQGFRAAGVYTGVKRKAEKLDLSLIVSDAPGGRRRRVHAEPRLRGAGEAVPRADAQRVDSGRRDQLGQRQRLHRRPRRSRRRRPWPRKAAAGRRRRRRAGARDVDRRHRRADADGQDSARASTPRPTRLAADEDALVAAARGHDDHRHAAEDLPAARSTLDGRTVCVCGIAKGAAMIGPNLATMLARDHDRRQAVDQPTPTPACTTRPTSRSTASASRGTPAPTTPCCCWPTAPPAGPPLAGAVARQVSGHARRSVRGPRPVDPRRRRRRHAPHHRRGPRLPHARRRHADRPDRSPTARW